MIGWAVLFLIIALTAAVFGFANVTLVSTLLAKIVFFAAIAMFAIAAVAGLIYVRSPRTP